MEFEKLKACIEACNRCAVYCDRCAVSCLQEENVQAMSECIRQDMHCAQLCRLAVTFMAQDSEYARDICSLCAKACRRCAEECGKHEFDHCQQCAEACYRCADECEHMAATV